MLLLSGQRPIKNPNRLTVGVEYRPDLFSGIFNEAHNPVTNRLELLVLNMHNAVNALYIFYDFINYLHYESVKVVKKY